jgi:hypothetical protein
MSWVYDASAASTEAGRLFYHKYLQLSTPKSAMICGKLPELCSCWAEINHFPKNFGDTLRKLFTEY